MTTLSNATYAVLRRRANEIAHMATDAINAFTIADLEAELARTAIAMRRAADELEARTRAETEGEAYAVALVADNRRLRQALVDLYAIVGALELPRAKREPIEDRIRRLLAALKAPGAGKVLLTVEIFPTQSRAEVEASIAGAIEDYFATTTAPTGTSPAADTRRT